MAVRSLDIHVVRQPIRFTPRSLIKALLRASTFGCKTGVVMTRYAMYERIRTDAAPLVAALRSARTGPLRIITISRSDQLLETLEVGRAPDITVGEYPEYNLLDLRNVPNASYDIVVSDQVLEHLEGDPQWAFNETHRVLTSGGIAIHTTCFFTEIHGGLDRETGEFRDNHRFTPRELRRLARQFRTIIAAGAGHKLWYFGFRYLDVPHATWHPIHKIAMLNNPATPYGVWVIAQK